MQKRVPTGVAFDPDLLRKVDSVRGRISRSTWLMLLVERALKESEAKSV